MTDSVTRSTAEASQALVVPAGADKPGLMYLILLVLVLFLYAFHLFSFTLFEGYATLSSDSFSYLRQALVWSPYSEAEAHVLNTLPEHVRAPGFSWVLAISGAAESTLRAHLLVSVLMLLSIAVGSWLAYRSAGLVAGIGFAIGFGLLPGAVISSLPILSENLYLLASMSTLILYERVLRGADAKPPIKFAWRLALLACLLLAILTRSVGLALVAAMVTAAIIGPGRKVPGKLAVILVGLLASAGWLSWNMLGAPAGIPGEQSYFVSIFAGQDQSLAAGLAFLWHSINQNIAALVRAWIHYLTLTDDSPLLFAGAFLLLAVVMLSTALRVLQFKADALYLCAYLAIILLWPFPQGMMRFLHPMVMLLLLQPVLLLGRGSLRASGAWRSLLIGLVMLILIGGGLAAQQRLLDLQRAAERHYPAARHAQEYYASLDRVAAINLPLVWQATIEQMKSSAGVIPQRSIVAAVKHEAFMLLAGRSAVMLSSQVSYEQQLCNFHLQDVDFVFLSPINSQLVPQPYELVDKYSKITEFVLSRDDAYGSPLAYVIKLDKQAKVSALEQAGMQCTRVVLY